jgi:hypothetical protein
LQRAGYSGDVEMVMLLVNELISHALSDGTPSHAVLEVSQLSVRVAVEDTTATQRQPSTAEGHELFDRLADAWGYDAGTIGRSIWFTIGRPGH